MIAEGTLNKLGLSKNYVDSLPSELFDIVSRTAEKMSQVTEESSVEFIKTCVSNADFKIPDELWPLLGENTGIEVWSGGSKPYFLFSNIKFMKYSSYSLEDVRSHSWQDLFIRDKIHELQCMNGVQKAMMTGQVQKNITPDHLVTERLPGHTNAAIVRVSAMSPFFIGEENVPMGIIVLTEYKRPS